MERRGFSLIELVVIVAIVAVLASLVAPRLRETRERAVEATLRSDLRRLRLAQEEYRSEAPGGGYAAAVDELGAIFSPSEDVTVTILRASRSGYAAEARHPGAAVWCVDSSGEDEARIRCGNRDVPPPESVRAVP